MLRAIELDHKLCFMTVKICNERTDGLLALKPDRILCQKAIPKPSFLWSRFFAQLFGKFYVFPVIFQRHARTPSVSPSGCHLPPRGRQGICRSPLPPSRGPQKKTKCFFGGELWEARKFLFPAPHSSSGSSAASGVSPTIALRRAISSSFSRSFSPCAAFARLFLSVIREIS